MLSNSKIKRLVNNVLGRDGFEVKKAEFTNVNEHFFTKNNEDIRPYVQKLKAFTMIELLITMTLSAILVVFAYMGYNQMQQLFVNYTVQSKFISDYNQLNKALFLISNNSKTIEKNGEHSLIFKTDSNAIELELAPKNILLKFKSHTDTFDIESKKMELSYLPLGNNSSSVIINHFDAEVFFRSQKFHVSFHKDYDAATILNSTLVLLPIKEIER
jgi:prepilin-type N-terminal cleavage/methylation domain-containing protein